MRSGCVLGGALGDPLISGLRYMSDEDVSYDPSDVNQSWIIGLASVVFDIDQGQTLECLYPEGIITEKEGKDVAFNSEPHNEP